MKKEEIEKVMLDWKIPTTKSKAEAWEEIQTKINQTQSVGKQGKVISMRKQLLAFTAAAAIVVFGFIYFSSDNTTSLKYASKQTEALVLPDGSKVWANANTAIQFDADDWSNERALSLDGEAYFEVKKGSSFTVNTSHGSVTVLGTSFNVLNRNNYFEVECYTGKVAVAASDSEQILTPGKATRLADNQLKTIYNIQELEADWNVNKFRFENQPLERVFDEMADTYKVDFQLDFVGEKYFTGNFEINDLESSLKTVCLPMELNYSIDGNTVVISE